MQIALCALIGYFFGNINPAFIIAKIKGFDIRQRGSGNAGASNTVITIGKKQGFLWRSLTLQRQSQLLL